MRHPHLFAGLIASVVALSAVLVARPALAVYGAEWFWTTERDANPVTYQQCLQRAPGALATTGVASGRNGNFFYADSPDFHVVLLCIDRAHGMNMVLAVTVAGGSQSASQIGTAINDAFWQRGTAQSAGCASPVGTWNWWDGATVTFYPNGTADHSGTSQRPAGNWGSTNGGSFAYVVKWSAFGSTDYLNVSPDGMSMPGNYNGNSATSHRKSPC